jgi:hypothetical protein
MFNVTEVLMWCFQQNYHSDKSNADIHCSPVRFSPLTFRIYQALMAFWPDEEDITQEMAEVKNHIGTYEEDKGR